MTPDTVQFAKFQKIPRLSREVVVTEKIDGTNAQVFVVELPGKFTEEELSTIPLVATKGRASYLGERSAGHMDPGAASSALILRALSDTLAAG